MSRAVHADWCCVNGCLGHGVTGELRCDGWCCCEGAGVVVAFPPRPGGAS